MDDNTETFDTIAAAEAVITAAGYTRDNQRHVWFIAGTGRTAKVMRDSQNKFFVQWDG